MYRYRILSLFGVLTVLAVGVESSVSEAGSPEAVASSAQAEEQVAESPDVASEAPGVQGLTTYSLDPKKTGLMVVVRADREALVAGHDHVIVSSNPTGSIQWDPSGASSCKVNISVPTSGLVVDPPGMREKNGLDDNTISDSQKKDLLSNMNGKGQLNSSAFPVITYEASSCSGTSGRVDVSGTMTIRGVAHSFSTPMIVSVTPDTFTAKGKISLSHSTFGFSPFTALLGALRNSDELDFVIEVHAKANP